jgi:hypothetical protein
MRPYIHRCGGYAGNELTITNHRLDTSGATCRGGRSRRRRSIILVIICGMIIH